MVSICCITYNHGRFIAQAIESFLMQQTNFEFEIIVGDDCSSDQTLKIVKLFSHKHPGKIKLITSPKNLGTHNNLINCQKFCTGKYVALCEGDDYWTDIFKLQKQVDFLEQSVDHVICCHYTRVINENNETLYVHPNPIPLEHTYFDLLSGKQEETKTASMLYRNFPEINQLFAKQWFFNCFAGDKIFKLFATHLSGKKIYVMPDVMSCYRNHTGGVWSMIDSKVRMERRISDFNLIIKNFTYPTYKRKSLLLLYIKEYLLFELRNRRLRKVYSTLKYLI
ncbi:glycosyltransferase (rhamnosyltransferase), family 2 (GT2) [Mucilaginibacter xinganensis]|uniref:Glycosyltransferase (Rhamnosyltransferase), family 2 (GT2) n=2 Tax=Mucilaginibacter xinganensis TaxID=1234841 RepID=A0A223NY84_9SPHI|nr:glycosyltransferase (rhamnosyltransferase), family 2 (GT2) [Mucilaginibacter xinganensis]